jgi:hypothetical protein
MNVHCEYSTPHCLQLRQVEVHQLASFARIRPTAFAAVLSALFASQAYLASQAHRRAHAPLREWSTIQSKPTWSSRAMCGVYTPSRIDPANLSSGRTVRRRAVILSCSRWSDRHTETRVQLGRLQQFVYEYDRRTLATFHVLWRSDRPPVDQANLIGKAAKIASGT